MCCGRNSRDGSKCPFDSREPGFVIHHQIRETIEAFGGLFELGFDDGNA